MKIDEMPAGREMDALVAEKVMGWIWEDAPAAGCKILYKPPHHLKAGLIYYAPSAECVGKWIDAQYWAGGEIGATKLPNYSTDIAAAWEVFGKLLTYFKCAVVGVLWYVSISEPISYYVRLDQNTGYPKDTCASTAPLAICRAALKVML